MSEDDLPFSRATDKQRHVSTAHTRTDAVYLRWLHEEESHDDTQLQHYEKEGNDKLSTGGHEARFLRADLLLAACQDPSDAVCLESDHKHRQDFLIL